MEDEPTGVRISVGSADRVEESHWKKVVRWISIGIIVVGFIIILSELYDNLMCPTFTLSSGDIVLASYCAKFHLSHMLWGATFIVFGLITVRYGDPSRSLQQVVASGTIVREWLRRGRSTDKAGTVVVGQVIEPTDDVATKSEKVPHTKDEDLSHD